MGVRLTVYTCILPLIAEDSSKNCTNGDIRLVGGSGDHEGNVEVCFNGKWGSVCEDRWDNIDARTVCGILGFETECKLSVVGCASGINVSFSSGALPTVGAYFGIVDGPIFLDEVECNGTETSILQCLSQDAGLHNCFSLQEAGAICPGRLCVHVCVHVVHAGHHHVVKPDWLIL